MSEKTQKVSKMKIHLDLNDDPITKNQDDIIQDVFSIINGRNLSDVKKSLKLISDNIDNHSFIKDRTSE